jgi:hypothetical protein
LTDRLEAPLVDVHDHHARMRRCRARGSQDDVIRGVLEARERRGSIEREHRRDQHRGDAAQQD